MLSLLYKFVIDETGKCFFLVLNSCLLLPLISLFYSLTLVFIPLTFVFILRVYSGKKKN